MINVCCEAANKQQAAKAIPSPISSEVSITSGFYILLAHFHLDDVQENLHLIFCATSEFIKMLLKHFVKESVVHKMLDLCH